MNVQEDEAGGIKWNKKDVVISDYNILQSERARGTAGWAPSEQLLGQIKRYCFQYKIKSLI